MTAWIIVGLVLVGMLAYVVQLILDDLGENHVGAGVVPYDSPAGWWDDADQPVGYQLTGLGEAAAVAPTEFVLDEAAETGRWVE